MDVVISHGHSEDRLIEACVNNEKWAQKEIYETHFSMMMGVCLRYTNSDDQAMDILHDGFIKVFKYIGKYKSGTSLKAWIKRIMINTAIDHYRKAARRRFDDIDNEIIQIASKEQDAVGRVSEQELLKSIQLLTPAYRAVFNLYVIEGFSHKEIGEKLGITESTSRSNLVKARTKLRQYLKSINVDWHE